VGKGNVVVEHVSFLSFKNCSLVIGSSETCRYYVIWCSWLVGDIGFSKVAIIGEGISDKGNWFLKKMSKIGLE
jgi:hypothetical protein